MEERCTRQVPGIVGEVTRREGKLWKLARGVGLVEPGQLKPGEGEAHMLAVGAGGYTPGEEDSCQVDLAGGRNYADHHVCHGW